jgi:nicotinamide riboside transporter PnuC
MAGFVTNVVGNMLLTRKSAHGWCVRIVSNLLWTVYAGTAASLSMNVNHGVFFLVNVYGWWKWRREATGFRPQASEERKT